MLGLESAKNIVVKNPNKMSKLLNKIYAFGLTYTLASFFILGIMLSKDLVAEEWINLVTKIQIYTSVVAIGAALWAKHKLSLFHVNIYDASTVLFYDRLDKKDPLAILLNEDLDEQERKITVLEAKKYLKVPKP